MAKDGKRIGRPMKPVRPGERVSLGLRVTAELKRRLDQAARSTGRTQSQEAEARLERTFKQDDFEMIVSFFEAFAIGQELDEHQQRAFEHMKEAHPAAYELAYARNLDKVLKQQP